MGISHSKKFIYFVIPKTGSSTVRAVFDPFRDVKRPAPGFSEHVTIARFLETRYAPLMREYFKFTFVRNPYDRLYSGFLQDRFAAYNLPHWESAKRPIFDEIGEDFCRYMLEHVQRADILNDPFWICFCPMHAFTHNKGRLMVDWIGRTEYLEVDALFLAQQFGISVDRIENKNVRTEPGNGLKYISRYSRDVIDFVNRCYEKDFQLFGYEKL